MMFKKKDKMNVVEQEQGNATGLTQKKKKKKIIRRVIAGVIVIAIVTVFVVSGITAKNAGIPVTVTQALQGDIGATIETSGTVKSEIKRTYFSTAATNVHEVNVVAGDIVKANDQLITYDVDELEADSKQILLQGESSAYDYQGKSIDNTKNYNQLATAVTDIQNYQVLMANYKTYIENLEESIDDEIVKKRANLYAQQYSLNKTINSYSHQMNLNTPGGETYNNLLKAQNDANDELARISNELSLLADYKTKDNREDVLKQAKKDYDDLQTAYNEARTKQSSAEAALQNGSTMKAAELASEATQASAENAKRILEEAKEGVKADFDGIVTEVTVVEGGPVTEGAKLLTVESNKDVKVEISASKYDLESLALDQKADVVISGNTYEGKVSKISHVAVPNASGTPMVTVENHIENPDDKIYLGIEGKVTVYTEEAKSVLLVPIEAVNADTEGDFCYIVEDDIIVRKPVTIGITSDEFVEIVEGLSEGDQVIKTLPTGAEEGSKVTIIPETEE